MEEGLFVDRSQYTGESMNPDGMVALLNYREDGVTRECILRSSVTSFL
jgi:hypothetical protein